MPCPTCARQRKRRRSSVRSYKSPYDASVNQSLKRVRRILAQSAPSNCSAVPDPSPNAFPPDSLEFGIYTFPLGGESMSFLDPLEGTESKGEACPNSRTTNRKNRWDWG